MRTTNTEAKRMALEKWLARMPDQDEITIPMRLSFREGWEAGIREALEELNKECLRSPRRIDDFPDTQAIRAALVAKLESEKR
jgi:hypothetical protein